MNYAKKVVEALVKRGSMDTSAAIELTARHRGLVVAGYFSGDAPEDLASDLYLTLGADEPVENPPVPLPKLRKPLRANYQPAWMVS